MSSFQIQCFTCEQWFSSDNVDVSIDGLMSYMSNYEYTCQNCGTEKIVKKPASFTQVGITAIANLMASSAESHFDLEKEIYPFVWKYWDTLCTKRSKSGSWKSNLSAKLIMETSIFSVKNDKFGLVDEDLSTIGPRRYESKTVAQKGNTKIKRKFEVSQSGQSTSKKSKVDTVSSVKGTSHGYPLEHPFNKDGYRYILAEQDPHSSITLDAEDLAGRPIPPELYRPWMSPTVLLSLHDRAPQLKVADNRLTVTGDRGYCMIRATHGVSEGTWYYEVHVDDLSCEGSALRIGWSQSLATLQAPCGFDKLSYSWRSKKGTVFHQSRGKHYSDGYQVGDVLGFLIHIPHSGKKKLPLLPVPTYKDKALIKFKNFFYFEEKDEQVEEYEKNLKPLKGSQIIFYKNGECQGVGFSDLYKGTYFPCISLYKTATVTVNFGPSFQCKPFFPAEYEVEPISFAAEIASIRQTIAEMLFHVESKVLSRTTAQYPSNYKFSQQS